MVESENSTELKLADTKSDGQHVGGEFVLAIFKVRKADYVPRGVRVRSRISTTMFTGELRTILLDNIKEDDNVVSISLSKKLSIIN